MTKKRVNIGINFADSDFKSFEMMNDYILIINLISWDNKEIKITFENCIQFSYKLHYHIANIFQVVEPSNFLNEALSENYEKIPNDHPFKLFQLEDLNDFPFIQVVAESVQVSKE